MSLTCTFVCCKSCARHHDASPRHSVSAHLQLPITANGICRVAYPVNACKQLLQVITPCAMQYKYMGVVHVQQPVLCAPCECLQTAS
jgi:hypothetical protein